MKHTDPSQLSLRAGDRATDSEGIAGIGRKCADADVLRPQRRDTGLKAPSFRATSATEKPSAPNFSATAPEVPGPKPTMMIVSDIEPLILGVGSLGASRMIRAGELERSVEV